MNTQSLAQFLIIVGIAGSACACGSDPAGSPADGVIDPSTAEGTETWTLSIGVHAPVHIATVPNAVCTLHPDVANSNAPELTLFADAEGIIRFDAYVRDGSISSTKISLNCQGENGARKVYPIELRIAATSESATTNPASQAAVAESSLSSRVRSARPPLSGDLLRLSQQELVSRGYPPRPDSARASAQYEAWLEAVSRPVTEVAGRFLHNSAQKASNVGGDSNNWSGFSVAPQQGGQIDKIYGQWSVPTVTGSTNCVYCLTSSSFWIGLDGATSERDVVQEGTKQQVLVWNSVLITSYYAWIEYVWDSLGGEVEIQGLTNAPGDSIYGVVWMGDVNGAAAPNGGYGWFYLQNTTQRTYWMGSIQAPAGAYFLGRSAEWIMERPNFGGSVTALANYGLAVMGATSFVENSTSYNLANVTSSVWTMRNNSNGHLLSTATLNPIYNVALYTWVASQ